jgi:2'-5' RNA ligase
LADRIDSYALVAYIPEPLAGFLNRLRRELVPSCYLQAHVTVLPPRKLPASAETGWRQVRDAAAIFDPFHLELGDIEVFPGTNVIYIGIRKGESRLVQMHQLMNRAGLWFPEPYEYHPHVTLAQEIDPERVDEMCRLARLRWREFSYGRRFPVETITFVQNTRQNIWVDLGECRLGSHSAELLEPMLAS